MEIINVGDFDCDGCSYDDIMINISNHCHNTHNKKIEIYGSNPHYLHLRCTDNSITFPKVIYVSHVYLYNNAQLVKVLPNLEKIGTLCIYGNLDVDDFGGIKEIKYYHGMSKYFNQSSRDYYDIQTICAPIGYKKYAFRSKKGSWNIKVNNFS